MDTISSLKNEELLSFFARNKMEISCLEKPNTLLGMLRDHNLVPEHQYRVRVLMGDMRLCE